MKIVEIRPDLRIEGLVPLGIRCDVSQGGVSAILYDRKYITHRKPVLEVRVNYGMNMVSFDFERDVKAEELYGLQVGDHLIMQMNQGIRGFDVLNASSYLSAEELEALNRLSQIPSTYTVR